MASSPKHDVFLSFRGTDTRYNFVGHLHSKLKDNSIDTYIDSVKLHKGEEISPALIKAIQESKISVIIFSVNYGNSKWCLEELAMILQCKEKLKQIVLPIFYKVAARDVRNQYGEFGSSFRGLQQNYKRKEGWRKALECAGKLSGWESSDLKPEADLVDDIVDSILKELKKCSNDDSDRMKLIGTETRIANIMGLLRIEESPDEFVIVGIWGMAGAGKTTIAEQVYKQLCGKFDRYYFLKNVGKTKKKEGLDSMRGNLISNLLNDETLNKPTPHIGDSFTNDRLRRTKVLVVLDDVDDYTSQLQKLIGELGTHPFGPGSRVIVTTRDKQVLNAHDITDVYKMEMLDDKEAFQLFCLRALTENQPANTNLDISTKMVEYAKGVPLVLTKLGLSLRGKPRQFWEGQLRKLKHVPDPEILKKLKISYDSLDNEEKEIFLDIACFFKGTSIDTVTNVLNRCYFSLHSGIVKLTDKSLIYISPIKLSVTDMTAKASVDGVEMHNCVQELGWDIVTRESNKAESRSRLWRSKDVYEVFNRKTGTEEIRCIHLDMSKGERLDIDSRAFKKMYNLKFLRIINSHSSHPEFVPRGIESFATGLKYFYWHKGPLDGQSTFNNPIEVHISFVEFGQLRIGTQNFERLQVLHHPLCYELSEIPDFSLAKNLEESDLTCCYGLRRIPSSTKHYFEGLTQVNMNGGYRLVEISYSNISTNTFES